MNSHSNSLPAIGLVLVNLLYVLGALTGLLLGVWGLFIFYVTVIIGSRFDPSDLYISSLYWYGVALGLPSMLIGSVYIVFVVSLLVRPKFKSIKYSRQAWLSNLLGMLGLWYWAYFVWRSVQGL